VLAEVRTEVAANPEVPRERDRNAVGGVDLGPLDGDPVVDADSGLPTELPVYADDSATGVAGSRR
jgi:hypothetical protein